ncbi:MAG: GNAT family N-acetyltransferase, partial [Actinobacteria bacterium]|nr:GNAT family N-acetyltransferase [Actinomycetota bacterium]
MDVSWADRIAEGLVAAWRKQVGYIEGGSVHEIDGLVLTLTNLPDEELNVTWVTRVPDDPAAALAEADALFSDRGRRLALDVEVGRHPEVERAAATRGLKVAVSRPAMARFIDDFEDEHPGPPGVEIRRAEDPADMAGVVDVNVDAFRIPRAVAERLLPPTAVDAPGVAFYLALEDGAPVGCAATFLHEGSVGVFGVGTIEAAQRRGIGTAVTARALADARADADLAWLQTTEMGRPV